MAQYSGLVENLKRYWSAYGGWQALFFSPYLHISLALTIVLHRFWMHEPWWELSISVLPSIIGFALGGYAIWLGFGDEKFRALLSQKDPSESHSPYMVVSATFAHFIIVQMLALLLAVIAKGTNYALSPNDIIGNFAIAIGSDLNLFANFAPVLYGTGFLFFSYALMTAIAATFALFRITGWFELHQNNMND